MSLERAYELMGYPIGDSQVGLSLVASNVLVTVNRESMIEWVSPSTSVLFGYACDRDMVGRPLGILLPNDHVIQAHSEYVEAFFRDYKQRILICRGVKARHATGKLFSVDIVLNPTEIYSARYATAQVLPRSEI